MTDKVKSIAWYKFSMFFQMFCIGATGLLPIYWQEITKFSNAQIGFLNAIALGCALIAPPLFGVFGSKYVPARLIFWCFIGVSISGILYLVLPSFQGQTLAHTLYQFARWGFFTLVPVGVLQILSDKAGTEYAAYRRYGSVGFLVGTIGLGILSDYFGLTVICVALSAAAICASYPFSKRIKINTFPESSSRYLVLLAQPELRNFFILIACICMYYCMAFTYFPVRLNEIGASKTVISVAVSLNGVIAFLSFPFAGRICDQFRFDRLMTLVILGASLRVLLVGLSTATWHFMLAQLLHVPSWVFFDTLMIKYLKQNCSQEGFAKAQALVKVSTSTGMALGSTIAALLALEFSLQASYLLYAPVPLLGLIPLRLMRKSK